MPGEHAVVVGVVEQGPQARLTAGPVAAQRGQAVAVGVARPLVGRELVVAAVRRAGLQHGVDLVVAAVAPQQPDVVQVAEHDPLVVPGRHCLRQRATQLVRPARVAELPQRPPAVDQRLRPQRVGAEPLPHRERLVERGQALALAVDVDEHDAQVDQRELEGRAVARGPQQVDGARGGGERGVGTQVRPLLQRESGQRPAERAAVAEPFPQLDRPLGGRERVVAVVGVELRPRVLLGEGGLLVRASSSRRASAARYSIAPWSWAPAAHARRAASGACATTAASSPAATA